MPPCARFESPCWKSPPAGAYFPGAGVGGGWRWRGLLLERCLNITETVAFTNNFRVT